MATTTDSPWLLDPWTQWRSRLDAICAGGEQVPCEPVVSGCDAAKGLESALRAVDQATLAAQVTITWALLPAIALGGHNRLPNATCHKVDQVLAVVNDARDTGCPVSAVGACCLVGGHGRKRPRCGPYASGRGSLKAATSTERCARNE